MIYYTATLLASSYNHNSATIAPTNKRSDRGDQDKIFVPDPVLYWRVKHDDSNNKWIHSGFPSLHMDMGYQRSTHASDFSPFSSTIRTLLLVELCYQSMESILTSCPLLLIGSGYLLQDNPASSLALNLHKVLCMLQLFFRHLPEETGIALQCNPIPLKTGCLQWMDEYM